MKHFCILFILLCTSSSFYAQNVGISSVISPESGVLCGTGSETYEVRFLPDHSDGYDGNVMCHYQLNSDPVVNETLFFGALLGLQSAFNQQITPSLGPNTLRIWTDFPGDTDSTNDEIIINFNYYVHNPTTPWVFNVESLQETNSFDDDLGCWEFTTLDTSNSPATSAPYTRWSVLDSNSNSEVPTMENGNKCFSPDFRNQLHFNAYLISPEIDISTLTLGELSFDYHIYGRYQEAPIVDIFHNGTWTENIGTIQNYERQLEKSDSWRKKTILLDGFSGIVKIRFRYYDPDLFQWYYGDYNAGGSFMGIDNIEVKEASACPAPKNLQILFDQISQNSASITWESGHLETNWEIEYGPTGFIAGTGSLAQSNSTTFVLNGLNQGQEYDVLVRANCGGTPGINDSTSIFNQFETVCSFTAPWTEDVESHLGTTRGRIKNCWKTSDYESHEFRWNVINDGGGTPSNGTGPSSAFNGNNYFYSESSALNDNGLFSSGSSYILSPYVDISSLSSPALSFMYHMYGQGIYSLTLDIYNNGSWHEDELIISGEQHSSNSDNWSEAFVDLSAYSGLIRLRLTSSGGALDETFRSDIAIDNIRIDEASVLSNSNSQNKFEVLYYPNPFKDTIFIHSNVVIDSLEISNVLGQIIADLKPNKSGEIEVPTTSLNSGIYFVKVVSNSKSEILKIIKD